MSDETIPGPCPQCEHRRELVARELPTAEQVARWWLDMYRSHYSTAFRDAGDPGLVIVTQIAHMITTARLDGARWNEGAVEIKQERDELLAALRESVAECTEANWACDKGQCSHPRGRALLDRIDAGR